MKNIIEINDLHFSYPADEGEEKAEVLKGIDLKIKEGEFMAVLGHNGSGKSTLAKHLNGILIPTSGNVIVDGIDTSDEEKIFDLRCRAGMVFQNPDNQIVSSIVEEDVAFALENLGVPYEEMRKRVDDALKDVNMYDYRLHSPSQLSGGQKQRVAIAGIIAMKPKCIVLDEPTAMLDPQGRREVMAVIRRMNREYGITIVLITHYMDEAAQCDRVVVMDKGRVILDDSPRAVFSHVEEVKKIGLDVPQATELAYELRKAGYDMPEDILTADECAEAIGKLIGGSKISIPHEEKQEKAADGSGNTALDIQGVTYVYSEGTPFEKTAVNNVCLSIKEGEMIGVMGHTGSGKSTLIQHFNGLLKPTSGKIFLEGKDIWADKKSIRDVRFKVGLVFQYPEYQIFEETVYKDIAFGPKNMKLDEAEIKKRVLETARDIGLEKELLDRSPFELSGGQKRRVAIAGVMAMNPKVLILDEPTAGLDPAGRDKILAHIREYHKRVKNTILIVSHSMEDIAGFADKILVMNKSELFCYDETERVFARAEELSDIGLDVPQVTKMFLKLRDMGIDLGKDVYTLGYAKKLLLKTLEERGGKKDC